MVGQYYSCSIPWPGTQGQKWIDLPQPLKGGDTAEADRDWCGSGAPSPLDRILEFCWERACSISHYGIWPLLQKPTWTRHWTGRKQGLKIYSNVSLTTVNAVKEKWARRDGISGEEISLDWESWWAWRKYSLCPKSWGLPGHSWDKDIDPRNTG